MKKLFALIVMICLVVGLVLASDDAGQVGRGRGRSNAASELRERTMPSAGRAAVSRSQLLSQARVNRSQQHQKEIAELNAIKKIAQEEEAVRTVEAIQKLISQKNEAFKKATLDIENASKQRAEQLRNRMRTTEVNQETKTAEKETQTAE